MTAKPHPTPASGRVLENLAARLLQELGPTEAELPRAPFDPAGFIRLYREAIETLEYRVAMGDGHAPMQAKEIALLCRCVLSNATLAEAIQCAAEFCALLHPRAGILSLSMCGDSALFKMDSLRKHPSPASCLVDITGLYSYLQLFGWLIGAPLTPRAVMLGYPRREDAAPFVGLFNAPVYTGGSSYGFEFAAALLERPVLRRPDELAGFLRDFPYGVVGTTPHAAPLRDQVRAALDAALARGRPLPEPAALAELLGAGPATLRRRLRAEGTSYSALREACVQETAERYLRDTDWDVETIAARLGFSDGSAFRRAFRRWRGIAPSALRRGAVIPRSD